MNWMAPTISPPPPPALIYVLQVIFFFFFLTFQPFSFSILSLEQYGLQSAFVSVTLVLHS